MDERQVLEAALNSENPSKAPWPPIAERIRTARERSGLSWDAVAEHIGEEPSNLWDLEFYDHELCTIIPINTIGRLAEILGLTVDQMLFGSPAQPPAARTSFSDIAARLSRSLESENLSAEELSDRIGWDISRILAEPESIGEYPIDGLRRLCTAIDVDWVTALPTPRADAG